MALEFVDDAISLSGLTGSKVKCDVIGQYYPFWWNITSGGKRANYNWPTAIVELYAATGEVYIKDIGKTILGSSGHALDLKCNNQNTYNLKVILVEEDIQCFERLKNVIGRRWKNVNSDIILLNENLENALDFIKEKSLGNALFFFDPLRSVEFNSIEKVANKRIERYYKIGTEFIIFIFTSDWFLGRDDFIGLPTTSDNNRWSDGQMKTVLEADALFGDIEWREQILNNDSIYTREIRLIELYRERLHKWFRYVLPMPFNPKKNQIFHLILCSNYEIGVKATRDFFCDLTGNTKYKPDNKSALGKFRVYHPEIFQGIKSTMRPLQWKMLWSIVKQHEEGICDYLCRDFGTIESNETKIKESLEWLETRGYLKERISINPWQFPIKQYKLDWPIINSKLDIGPSSTLEPLSLRPIPIKEISE